MDPRPAAEDAVQGFEDLRISDPDTRSSIIIGFIGAIMGIGDGFLLVPALIYLIRVPSGVVIGTSMVLTLVTMTYATVIHAATNHLVDTLLALILMIGSVIGHSSARAPGSAFPASSFACCSASW